MERLDHPNLLCLKYEDILTEPLKHIQILDKFIGTNLNIKQMDEVLESSNFEHISIITCLQIVDYTSFSAMKKRDAIIMAKGDDPMMNKDVFKEEGAFFRQGRAIAIKKVIYFISMNHFRKVWNW